MASWMLEEALLTKVNKLLFAIIILAEIAVVKFKILEFLRLKTKMSSGQLSGLLTLIVHETWLVKKC